MTDVKLFEKWVKKSLSNTFHLQALENEVIVTDGFVAFKIKRSQMEYINALKNQTFQELNENFRIFERKIEKNKTFNFHDIFDLEKKDKITDTGLLYSIEVDRKLRVFKAKDKYIFVDQKLLEVVNKSEFDLYGDKPVEPVVLHSDQVDIAILPVRLTVFPYEINKVRYRNGL